MDELKIGYARVSTTEQNLDLQIQALKEAGADPIYTDKMSAWNAKRPQFRKCMLHLRRGDTLVVWKLDRLARSARALQNLAHMLEQDGIALEVTSMNFGGQNGSMSTATGAGKMLFGIMCLFAEFESNLISERTKAGMAIARKNKTFGRPVKLTPDVWARAIELVKDGFKTQKVVALLNKEFGTLKKTTKGERWTISHSTIAHKRTLLEAGAAYPFDLEEDEGVINRRYAFSREGWDMAIEMHRMGCSAKDIADEITEKFGEISHRTVESYMPFIKEEVEYPFVKAGGNSTAFDKNKSSFDWEDM